MEVDGAAIYSKPSFDAPVINYLKAGTKLLATVQRVKGIGGFGLFYKVKTTGGEVGYVADTDLITEFNPRNTKKKPVKKNPVYEEVKEAQENPHQEPVYFTRYIGGGVGYLGFTEKFSGKEFSSNVMMFNFKMSGPGTLFDGPPLDFNFSFSPSAPDYYEKFSRGPAGGFFIFTDLLLNLPLIELNKGLVFYGVGIMTVYTQFKPVVSTTTFDSQEIRMGAAVSLGYAHRFGKYALRWDSKYYFEKTDYFGHWLSFQLEYR